MRRRVGTLCVLLAAASAASAPTQDTWSSFNTALLQSVRRGERELIVQDCRRFRVGGRVRISFASEEEEEGSVASISCSHADREGVDAPALTAADDDCNLAALAEGGNAAATATAQTTERCKAARAAALSIPGLAASYRVAARTGARDPAARHAGALLPERGVGATGPSGVHGAATLRASEGVRVESVGVPGVVTLAAGVLFSHAVNVSLHGAEPLTAVDALSVGCPVSPGGVCAGRGHCSSGSCVCDEGWSGATCEREACAGGCGAHGTCLGLAGTCVCDSGWMGAACSDRQCEGGCSGRGSCVQGHCVCPNGFYGAGCASHTLQACPDACGGHGNCAVLGDAVAPTCLCHAKYVGVSCMQALNECPNACSEHGRCVANTLTNQPECACYPGYSAADCGSYCPHNCTTVTTALGGTTTQGRCSNALVPGSTTELQCICKEGFSGPDCSQTCPSRCNGHGDCVNGMCQCREGYDGPECETLAARYLSAVFLEGLQGFNPVMLPTTVALMGLCCFCCMGYSFNRWRGRFGTSAIPMWDYYAKRWRNAPLFEPIFAVPAATQTAAPQESKAR